MNRYCCLIILLLTLWLAGCTAPPNPDPPPAPTPLPDVGLHFLLTGSGDDTAQIKRLRQGWTAFHPASWGATSERGDLIQPPPDSIVTILCADLSLHILTAEGGNPCQVSQPALFWEGERIINPMAPHQPVPSVIYPRSTKILEERPLLRWRDNGATSYTVAIVQDGRAIWEQVGVVGNELLYPANAPPLQQGVSYLLEVRDETSSGSSGQEGIPGRGFQLLTDAEVTAVRQKEVEIGALPLDEAGQQFVLAVYYTGQGLYGKALTALESASAMVDSPQIWLWQGRVLIAMRLNEDALVAYTTAILLAKAIYDIESQAQAETMLWQLTGEARHLDTAETLYQQFGNK